MLDVYRFRSHTFILGMFSTVGLNGSVYGAAGGSLRQGQSQVNLSVLAAATQRPHEGALLKPRSGKCLMMRRLRIASQLM